MENVIKFCSLLGFSLAFLIIVVFVRTFTLHPRVIESKHCNLADDDFISVDADGPIIEHFLQAIRFKTVSRNPGDYNADELASYLEFIQKTYPTIHSSPLVKRDVVANYSLLYEIQGTNKTLKPFLLMAHLDVVPASGDKWEVPPFEGVIKDGYIYGRGTIDVKQSVMGILEALEFLLKKNIKPKRSFYVAFGHDEEVTGIEGAYAIGQLLKKRNVELEFLMDEGLTITNGIIQGMPKPTALVGASEKGSLSLRLSVNASGGHSSMPTGESAIGILAAAVSKLESNPHPSRFGLGPERGTFEHIAAEMALPFRVVMSNLWLFGGLVARVLSTKPAPNAIVRTTTAVTEFHAGVKVNVIAPHAWATVNHRIHPVDTVQGVLDYDRLIINDDRVQIEILDSMEPHHSSPYDDMAMGYQLIKKSIRQIWGYMEVVVAPGVMVGNTDVRHYQHLTKNIYRFSPTYMKPDDLSRFHGFNERISVKNYQEAVNFFYHLMRNADIEKLEPPHAHGDL